QYKSGDITVDKIIEEINHSTLGSMEFANVDYHRSLRQGFPEVIFCRDKSPAHVLKIARGILERNHQLLATHASNELYKKLAKELNNIEYDSEARCIHSPIPSPEPLLQNAACIVTGGTSDLPVAAEAELTMKMFGVTPTVIYDVGVAGIHRLNAYWNTIQKAHVLIVVAGMEGALPTVVAGLTDKPVIAVPTSTGYGVNFEGVTPLLAMLNSCANSVTVVNINNGFGAGFSAALFLRQMKRFYENQTY
ncbi:MAG: nickel pincer cofactor biosynthesis protein LarB, partial [candidate division Zixibacteria bacterium]|nr:nickel pincer cofactor biosynthesis protein LarB [candidate division KSB1 bacterium]NIS46767.1 nickel pincer cofactor biosynthesis protein LarB [candidate division Zixibacteria bacterium]NIT73351.1 nickel pincer cofactor biosynthesis protein LarB [candidate division KSB1 bacterium]NIV08007.1 nickel pincer cofactor biosynthesis protein LarB [candidate division Zixibacteria bacterium]NIW71649.1 nickel pincer cofactor biosynthesis protein LarB [candidate division KSB1 bacterium]